MMYAKDLGIVVDGVNGFCSIIHGAYFEASFIIVVSLLAWLGLVLCSCKELWQQVGNGKSPPSVD